MIPARLPLSDANRQRLQDDRLWSRELARAVEHNIKRVHCPCKKCRGCRRLLLQNVKEHLIQNGRDPNSRVWRVTAAEDSSDKEWEQHFWRAAGVGAPPVDDTVDTCGMINQAAEEVDVPPSSVERVHHEVSEAFATADSIHENTIDGGTEDVGDDEECRDDVASAEGPGVEGEDDNITDARVLEDSLEGLYEGSRSTKLASTVLLMNLCTVHGVSNHCANELFSILHLHLLPENNTLPKTYHAAKTLTTKLGLTYNTIHACEKGCVLFRGPHADALRCPKCRGRRYRDEDRRALPVKVLRHFPIIPRL